MTETNQEIISSESGAPVKQTSGRSLTRRGLIAGWCSLTALACASMLLSAYGGYINPDVTTIGALMAMAFPGFIMLVIIFGLASIWINRWAAIACAVTFMASIGPILDYAPVNFRGDMPSERLLRDSSFTFMSYNVLNLRSFKGEYPNDSTNATLSYILRQNPDVACLVECEYMSPMERSHVYQPQVDSICERYPYHHIDSGGNSLFSRYPFRPITLEVPDNFNGRLAAYRAFIHNRTFTIFVVHMTSIGLSSDDKELFRALTRLNAIGEFDKVRHQILGKLSVAFRDRAQQARILRDMIDRVGEGNVIVAGDFNDIQGCYALRTIMGNDFKSVYSECGMGPAVTYYGNKFYFRIDHILYRGDIDPLWVRVDKLKTSDHYPILTQFLITN